MTPPVAAPPVVLRFACPVCRVVMTSTREAGTESIDCPICGAIALRRDAP